MIYGIKDITRNVSANNTKIIFHGYEISIAMDDSCGVLKDFSRTEIRVFKGEDDVTTQFSKGYHQSTGDDLFEIMQQIAVL